MSSLRPGFPAELSGLEASFNIIFIIILFLFFAGLEASVNIVVVVALVVVIGFFNDDGHYDDDANGMIMDVKSDDYRCHTQKLQMGDEHL